MNERINLTSNEKLASSLTESANSKIFTMNDKKASDVFQNEKIAKFNDQIDEYSNKLEEFNKECNKNKESLEYDPESAEIKPMFSRVIIKPFSQNPFQRVVTKGRLIIDAGGYTPHTQLNPETGKYEEQKEFIVTGCVMEIGPDVKYLKEGDVVYYRIDTAVPVPFFKQGFISLDEHQIIAVVNENLTKRFKEINNGR